MSRGKFIVLEGLDRSGKSTQVERLVKKLDAKLQKFPDRSTAIGGMIDAYLQSKADMDDHAIHLLFSANRWEVAKSIEEALASGQTIVADRYAFSGIAFSAAKGLAFDYCAQPDSGLPLPDLVLYLTLSPEAAAARGAYGEERYENVEMQQKTREKFAMVGYEMDRAHPGRWKEIDASGTIDEVEQRIWEVVQGLKEPEVEMGKLWHPQL